MASYKLSQAADEDFENMFNYGIDTFGLEQAVVYQTGMKMRFDEMAENPMLYNAVDHIKQGYRRSVFAAHSIYYTIENDGIKIIWILGRQDSNKALSKPIKPATLNNAFIWSMCCSASDCIGFPG